MFKTIVTHSGSFHADEALAVFMLRTLPKYSAETHKVIRTRDPEIIAKADIVVDVGGEYDSSRSRFDHHQRGFTETYSEKYNIKLSSAGLVYKHFGKSVIEILLEKIETKVKLDVDEIVARVYEKLILAFDAVDNGVNMYESDIVARYENPTTIGARVGRLNPEWHQEFSDTEKDERFLQAVALCGEEFVYWVNYFAKVWVPCRQIVKDALVQSLKIDPTGQIVVLERWCPWNSHLVELEICKVLYVIYGDDKGYRVQAVSLTPGSFDSRKALPEPWRGVRDEALSELTGVHGI